MSFEKNGTDQLSRIEAHVPALSEVVQADGRSRQRLVEE